jgi:hypothetical protein
MFRKYILFYKLAWREIKTFPQALIRGKLKFKKSYPNIN